MKAVAPGKLLLTGEHAVVYKSPAIVMAVNRYAECSVDLIQNQKVRIELGDWGEKYEFSIPTIKNQYDEIVAHFKKYKNGLLPLTNVLPEPVSLINFIICHFGRKFDIKSRNGIRLELKSSIPVSSGMGSSAAIISSVLYALEHFYDKKMSDQERYDFAVECENLQHGRSSGVDPFVSLNGGCWEFNKDRSTKIDVNPDFMLLDTGKPASTTGECVQHVKQNFGDSNIWREFAEVANAFKSDWRAQQKLIEIVKKNHKLLCEIGVVPVRIQQFINEVEKRGGAAKISGAGSISGDNAGMVLVFGEKNIKDLSGKYSYKILNVQGDSDGVQIS